jgi:hypothetical protein
MFVLLGYFLIALGAVVAASAIIELECANQN